MTTTLQLGYYINMKIKSQRKKYLAEMRANVMPFWTKVVEQYNDGVPAREIAKMYINSKTGKPYSRQHIHSIVQTMRELK